MKKKRKIRVYTTEGVDTVMARVYGAWAVHPKYGSIRRRNVMSVMSVTHIASGLSLDNLAGDLSARDAVTIAQRLAVIPRDWTPAPVPDDWGFVIMAIVGGVLGG